MLVHHWLTATPNTGHHLFAMASLQQPLMVLLSPPRATRHLQDFMLCDTSNSLLITTQVKRGNVRGELALPQCPTPEVCCPALWPYLTLCSHLQCSFDFFP